MMIPSDEAGRQQFFEAACHQAESEYEADNTNAQALVRWGGALLELAHLKQGSESTEMIHQCIAKLQRSLELNADQAEANWCLGNAYTSLGFLCSEKPKAMDQFDKAADCFRKCQAKEPSSEMYRKAIEMCDKAPEYYDEIQAHIQAQNLASEAQAKQPAVGPNDFWWDLGGWAVLAVVITGALLVSKATAPARVA